MLYYTLRVFHFQQVNVTTSLRRSCLKQTLWIITFGIGATPKVLKCIITSFIETSFGVGGVILLLMEWCQSHLGLRGNLEQILQRNLTARTIVRIKRLVAGHPNFLLRTPLWRHLFVKGILFTTYY